MIPAWANDYVGIPYNAHGRSREGLDCWGLVCLVFREVFGLGLPSYDDAPGQEDAHAAAGYLEARRLEESRDWAMVSPLYARMGDLIVFRLCGVPVHVGIVLDDTSFLHCSEFVDVAIDSWRGVKWGCRIDAVYRHPGVANA